MTPAVESIHLLNAGLSEAGDEIIAQGFLDITGMGHLLVDDYQREVLSRLSSGRRNKIETAIIAGKRLPSIVVGMRGQRFTQRGTTMILHDKCYIVDGLQRVSALKEYAENFPDTAKTLRIGVEVRFGTTKESEKELFHVLNTARTPMSPNIILRNMRDKNRAILTLYGLSMSDTSSPLYRRVQWNQRMARGELITAGIFAQIGSVLHGSYSRGKGVGGMGTVLTSITDRIGLNVFRKNISTYIDVLDKCFGLSKIQFAKTATITKGNFLIVLAKIFYDHENFWDGPELIVDASMREKLSKFPLEDFEVMRLSGAGSMAQPILYGIMRDHINKGRRSNRLIPRGEIKSRNKTISVGKPEIIRV